MSQTYRFTCDICGEEGPGKRQSFGLSRRELPEGWRDWTLSHPNPNKGFFDTKYRSLDLCSEECLRTAMQRYLDGVPAGKD